MCAQYLVPGVCSLHTKAFFLPVDIQHTFSLFFFFFLRFSLSFLLFSVFSFLVPFSFVLSFRLIVFRLLLVSPSSLLFSLPCFPYWRILLFCYFASALHSPRPPCESEVCVFPLRTVFFLALLMLTYVFFFFLPSLFRFRFGHRLFSSCIFLVGTMLSPRFLFLLRLV